MNQQLLILNYAVNPNHPIFGHQCETIEHLAKYFRKIIVITNEFSGTTLPENVTVHLSDWQESKTLISIFRFYKILFQVTRNHKIDIAFAHMVDLQSMLAGPVFKLMRIRNVLWYAHARKSFFLTVASVFTDIIVSSTQGSMPLKSNKIKLIGQAIDTDVFKFNSRFKDLNHIQKFVHMGRLDKSKEIIEMITFVHQTTTGNNELSIDFYGRLNESHYSKNLEEQFATKPFVVKYCGSIERKNIPEILKSYDCFLHFFEGSLDKSILEATSCGLPVITKNKEYLNDFGSWSGEISNDNPKFVSNELKALSSFTNNQIHEELLRRRMLVENKHSLKNWINQLIEIFSKLNEGDI